MGNAGVTRGRRARGLLEREVMATLGASADALSPAQVRASLGDDLAYTTVLTVLARLHGKGLVARVRSGRTFIYRVVAEGADLTARQMRRLLDAGDDRAAVLSRFVDVLTRDDEAFLAGLLRRAQGNRK